MNKMEHITVVYFSPTGGTRKACLNLAMEMGKKVKDVDLCSLEGEYSFGPEDTVIVGVPVFGGRIPGYAAEKLTYLKGGGAVALTAAVYGNRAFEDALLELDDCLKTQGFRIGAGTALLAEHSMVRDVAAGRPDNQDRKEMADFGARILEKLEEEGWQEPQVPGNRPYQRILHILRAVRCQMSCAGYPCKQSFLHGPGALHPLHALYFRLSGEGQKPA